MTYSAEFEQVWQSYGKVKNQSKSKAYSSFLKLKINLELLLAEIRCYRSWLTDQSKKQGREYPQCHLATWLNQGRFESFEDEAKELLSRASHLTSGRDFSQATNGWDSKQWAAVKCALIQHDRDLSPGAIYETWIKPTRFYYAGPMGTVLPNVPHPHIECPSEYHRSELEKRFGNILRKAFGTDLVIIAAKKEARKD